MTASKPLLVGIVGPCGSGKSTLAAALDSLGFTTRHIAQEHSYVKDMWKRLSNPDVLVFLQASFLVTRKRRPNMIMWTESDYNEQQRRLAYALEHADLVVDTDELNEEEVLIKVRVFLESLA